MLLLMQDVVVCVCTRAWFAFLPRLRIGCFVVFQRLTVSGHGCCVHHGNLNDSGYDFTGLLQRCLSKFAVFLNVDASLYEKARLGDV